MHVPKLAPPMTPIFDSSNELKSPYFRIGIERRRFIYLHDAKGLLNARTGRFDLGVEKRVSLLQGKISQEKRNSFIRTFEHGVKARFNVDLQELTASYAPNLSQLLAAKIETAKRNTDGDMPKKARLMEEELRAQKPTPDMPPLPLNAGAYANAAPNRLNQLESAAAKSKLRAAQDAQHATQQIAQAQPQGKDDATALPDFPKIAVIMPNSRGPALKTIPTPSKSDISAAERQMKTQLLSRKSQVPSDSTIDAELRRAKNNADNSIKLAQPAMDSVLTSLHTMPKLKLPNPSDADNAVKAEVLSTTESSTAIEWDKWHARFAQLARAPILKAIKDNGNPSGSNTVEITVKPDHRVTVRLAIPGTDKFDQAILRAYQSLDGNADLTFPSGSRRAEITFLIDNKHIGKGTPSRVTSKTSIGDTEIVRFHR